MKLKPDHSLELMSPAGSYASLSAAVRSGADSVYFGVDRLNMRVRAASPFTLTDLRKIARICRSAGVRSYLTLNTIVYDGDLELVGEICAVARDAGIDAVIAMDIAAIEQARETGLEVHISVQANISNIRAVRFYAQYADVMVLARELGLEQIRRIAEAVEEEDLRGPSGNRIRIEAFVHGALCVAVSGKCYMSLGLYNRSANRGECLQPCRRKYRVADVETGDELEIENNFVMSPKDICLIQHMDKLVEAGVNVFKIEGRGRSAEYVVTVTAAYRKALDAVMSGEYSSREYRPEKLGLDRVFNRGFWKGGYYCGTQLGEWSGSGHSQATRRRIQLGLVNNYYRKIGVMEFKLWQSKLERNSEIIVEGPTTGVVEIRAEEIRVNDESVSVAGKGDRVTIGVPRKVRRNDKVFQSVER